MDQPSSKDAKGPDQAVSRRKAIKVILVSAPAIVTAGGVLAPIVAYLWPQKQAGVADTTPIAVAAAADLPVGKGKVYSVANKPVIVIHAADGFHALSATCTHLACIVAWDEQRGIIACPCHAGFFTVNGNVISGPPPAPLKKYQVEVRGDQIYVGQGQG